MCVCLFAKMRAGIIEERRVEGGSERGRGGLHTPCVVAPRR